MLRELPPHTDSERCTPHAVQRYTKTARRQAELKRVVLAWGLLYQTRHGPAILHPALVTHRHTIPHPNEPAAPQCCQVSPTARDKPVPPKRSVPLLPRCGEYLSNIQPCGPIKQASKQRGEAGLLGNAIAVSNQAKRKNFCLNFASRVLKYQNTDYCEKHFIWTSWC